jgi:hypothetical protein
MLISSENGRTHPVIPENRAEELTDRDLPLGQRLLKAGYKVITMEQLEKRFCCDKITGIEIEKAKEKIAQNVKKFRQSHWWRRKALKKIVVATRYNIIEAKNWDGSCKFQEKYKNCILETKPIDDFVANVIPERCLISLKKARQIGMSHFNVIYPVMDRSRLKDPVIVGASNDKFDPMYEIDFWE